MNTWTWALARDGEIVGEIHTEWHCDLDAVGFARRAAALPRPVAADAVWVWAGEDTTIEPVVRMRRHPRRRALAVAS